MGEISGTLAKFRVCLVQTRKERGRILMMGSGGEGKRGELEI